jgi:thiamine transporter
LSEITSQTRILTEGILAVALTIALKDVLPPVFRLPQGGSVTAAGMVPLLWFSLRRGLRSGLGICSIYGLVHMVLRASNIVHPIQALLEYPIAFGALGLAGFFKRSPSIGVTVGITVRFLAHFLAGVIFWSIYAPEGMHPAIYSAIYNGGYLIIELIVSASMIYVIQKRGLLQIYLQ